jgi:hypothetical protein
MPAPYIVPASRVPCFTGPEDGTGGARQYACTTLHGMDHRMTSELDVIGQTNCRTHARHGVKHCSSGNGLRQMIEGGGSRATERRALFGDQGLLPHDTQCLTHHEWHHNFFNTAAPATDSGR